MTTFPQPNRDLLLNRFNVTSRTYLIRLQGKHAFLAGAAVDECPHKGGSDEEGHWMAGWREEFFDNMDAVETLL